MNNREQTTTTVVFFLGGCTYTEIAALRWVGRQNRGQPSSLCVPANPLTKLIGRNFLIATTGIISGTGMIDSIVGPGSSVEPKEVGI